MSLLIACPACGAQFKAPEHLAGRTVRCLKCSAQMVVSADPAPTNAAAPPDAAAPVPLPVAEPLPSAAERSTTWLTAFLLTGLGVAFVLVVALLVVLLNRSNPRLLVENSPENNLTEEEIDSRSARPPNPAETESKPAAEFPRAERLAELEAQEKEALAPLENQHAANKGIVQRLRKEEDEIFKKTKFPGKAAARYATFLKDSAFAARQINKDTLTLLRKREEFIQAKRKLIYDHPQPDDPKLELYGSLVLTAEEIADLGKQTISFGAPRAAAQEHILAAAAAGSVATPLYKETRYDPDDADLAVVSYGVPSYRGKKAADTQVHIFVHRWRGAWAVLELPGRVNSVLLGPPPAEYKRTAAGS